jgi:hypothetical protein
MMTSGGVRIVLDGIAKGNVRFTRPLRAGRPDRAGLTIPACMAAPPCASLCFTG